MLPGLRGEQVAIGQQPDRDIEELGEESQSSEVGVESPVAQSDVPGKPYDVDETVGEEGYLY